MEIKFIAHNRDVELIVEPPVPAKKIIPDWYKSTPRFLDINKPSFEDGQVINNSVKGCMPFYDSMTSGYIQKTWCDIHVDFDYKDNNIESFNYNFSSAPPIINHRQRTSIPINENFHSVEFIWRVPWLPIMPKGWSCLLTHPLNRDDLPFRSLSAIIDSDSFFHTFGGAYPFYINKNFNDKIIPAGTPMYQITPIKRENWNSKAIEVSEEERKVLGSKIGSTFISRYKKLFHSKKTFN